MQNPSAGQTNFRIGPLSNNVSREYSAKKQVDLNISNNGGQVRRDERSKNQPQDSQGGGVFQRRSSKVLLTRNGSSKGGALEGQASYTQQRILPSTGQSEYNLLAGINRNQDSASRGASTDINKKGNAQVEFKLKDYTSNREETGRTSKKTGTYDANDNNIKSNDQQIKELPQKEPAVVHWADCLNGQDVRTELKFGDCLGQGSFAKVYEGFDKRLRIPVAIKVIDKRKIKDSETKKKALIEEEIYIFSKLDHPNIVKFIRLIEDIKRVVSILLRFL